MTCCLRFGLRSDERHTPAAPQVPGGRTSCANVLEHGCCCPSRFGDVPTDAFVIVDGEREDRKGPVVGASVAHIWALKQSSIQVAQHEGRWRPSPLRLELVHGEEECTRPAPQRRQVRPPLLLGRSMWWHVGVGCASGKAIRSNRRAMIPTVPGVTDRPSPPRRWRPRPPAAARTPRRGAGPARWTEGRARARQGAQPDSAPADRLARRQGALGQEKGFRRANRRVREPDRQVRDGALHVGDGGLGV